MKVQELEQLALSKAETREVITPYAFEVDNALLGLPLASPTRRALAMISTASRTVLNTGRPR